VLEMLRDGRLSAGHARALVTAVHPERLAGQVVERDLSVRQTEALVRGQSAANGQRKPADARPGKDADTRALEEDLTATLRLKVSIEHKPGQQAGELRIRYSSLEELDGLCQLLSN
jgi:ParB family transcriptional regulator, chromosome partitioning protein